MTNLPEDLAKEEAPRSHVWTVDDEIRISEKETAHRLSQVFTWDGGWLEK